MDLLNPKWVPNIGHCVNQMVGAVLSTYNTIARGLKEWFIMNK